VYEQYRRLEIKLDDAWIDFTQSSTPYPVTIEDHAFGLDKLAFTLTGAGQTPLEATEFDLQPAVLLDLIRRGQEVRFKGGYLEGRREWLFYGYIADWEVLYRDSGKIDLSVTAYDPLWLLTLRKPSPITYPSRAPATGVLYNRQFHRAKAITLKEIVQGILAEYNLDPDILKIPDSRNFEFTELHPITQKEDETDYKFLDRLLTGKAGSYDETFTSWQDEAYVFAGCVFFAETSGAGTDHKTRVCIFPQLDLLAPPNAADTTFVFHRYQGTAAEFVTRAEYAPDDPKGKMPIHNVVVKDDGDKVIHDRRIIKEAARKKGTLGPYFPVATQTVDDQSLDNGNEDLPPAGWQTWTPDPALVRAARRPGGELFNVSWVTVAKKWTWAQAKKYFTSKQILFHPSAAPAAKTADDEDTKAEPTATLGAGGGSGKKKKPDQEQQLADAHALKFGVTVTCHTFHGNPTLVAKKCYDLRGLLERYSGTYLLVKAVHVFGDTYKNELEFGL
jgi:hypothetical protein